MGNCSQKYMNKKRGNLLFLLGRVLKFNTKSVFSGLQVLYISISIVLLLLLLSSLFLDSVNTYSNPKILTFYTLVISAFSISILATTRALGKYLDAFNRRLLFTLISYIYLLLFVAPLNIAKLFKTISSKRQVL